MFAVPSPWGRWETAHQLSELPLEASVILRRCVLLPKKVLLRFVFGLYPQFSPKVKKSVIEMNLLFLVNHLDVHGWTERPGGGRKGVKPIIITHLFVELLDKNGWKWPSTVRILSSSQKYVCWRAKSMFRKHWRYFNSCGAQICCGSWFETK